MPVYTREKLNQDIVQGKVEYAAASVADIRQKEWDFIAAQEFRDTYDYHIGKLNLDFHQSILPLKAFFPKTYQYLLDKKIKYELTVKWCKLCGKNLYLSAFFELNQRLYFLNNPSREYFLNEPSRKYDFLPDYLQDAWLKAFDGVLLSHIADVVCGTMLVGDPYNRWRAFDGYLPHAKRKAKRCIESLVKKIPYAYVDIEIEEMARQEPHRSKGFPNLCVMIDARLPGEYPEEYDLILMCYQYDHRVFWVKDRDFIGGIYEIANPPEMLDAYFLHVFSQENQDYTRFDFSPWARTLQAA